MPSESDFHSDTSFRAARVAVATTTAAETVILDPVSGRYYGLDAVGSRVWEHLTDGASLAHLVDVVTEVYDVDAETCERDLRALLKTLLDRGLVEIA